MTGDDELKSAQRLRDEATELRRQAAVDLEKATYERGQAEHRLRTADATERSIAEREQRLTARGIADLDRREKAAAKALADAKALMASYDKEKHAAAISLNQINEREKAERSAAA
jgi:hypothetical protein